MVRESGSKKNVKEDKLQNPQRSATRVLEK